MNGIIVGFSKLISAKEPKGYFTGNLPGPYFTKRYGAAEVKTWYFEVWNEPNLSYFWSGTQQQYYSRDIPAKSIGKPHQLTKQQVTFIKEKNVGSPVYNEMVKVKSGKPYHKELKKCARMMSS